MKISYNWLKWYIPDAPDAEKLHDVLTYHLTEVEGLVPIRADGSIETDPASNEISDWILDVNILPNRAHDLLSHKGVALEISGQLGLNFVETKDGYDKILAKKEIQKTNLQIDIQTNSCRRYSARIVRNIKVGPSPDWVVKHLENAGQRSINNIVDATNLVMLNCGQPTHAFDLRKFSDQKIVITNAGVDEELTLVGRDAIVAKLKETDLVITNSGGETLALGGIKGGVNSGIQDDTVDIVLEVGNFDPICIRKTARRIGVLSDAAKRFENNLTPELCDFGMLELSALICEMCPDAVLEEVVDVYPVAQVERIISFTSNLVNKKLGSSITDVDIENILKNYKYEYVFNAGTFKVTAPVFRLDLESEIDMVEEIGRIYGYDKLVPIMPDIKNIFTAKENEQYNKIESIRNDLISNGYNEVMTYSFCKKGDIQIARGAKGKDFLRTNLTDGLRTSYELNKNNAPLLNQNEIKIFEIGTVFINDTEEIHVAYANKSEVQESNLIDFASILTKNLTDRAGEVVSNIPFTDSASTSNYKLETRTFTPWSQYPFITRDISVWVPVDITDDVVLENIKNSINELVVVGPNLFDKFSKDGKNSYAFRMVFQAKDRTLTDTEIAEVMQKIEANLKQISGLEIR